MTNAPNISFHGMKKTHIMENKSGFIMVNGVIQVTSYD